MKKTFVQQEVARHFALQAARLATYGLPAEYPTRVPAPERVYELPFRPQMEFAGVGEAIPETV